MNTQKIKEGIDTQNNIKTCQHPQVAKKRNSTNITISIILMLAGIAAISAFSAIETTVSALGITLLVGGIILTLSGLILFLFKSTRKIYAETGSIVKSHIHYFDKEDLRQLELILPEADFDNARPLIFLESGNAYLSVLVSEDKRFVAAQLFEFIPFIYEPVTSIHYYTDKQAEKFSEYLDRCKINSLNSTAAS